MYPLLNQALQPDEYTTTAQFPNMASSKKQLSIGFARKRPEDPRIPSRRKCGETIHKHLGADADHVSTVEPDTKPTGTESEAPPQLQLPGKMPLGVLRVQVLPERAMHRVQPTPHMAVVVDQLSALTRWARVSTSHLMSAQLG